MLAGGAARSWCSAAGWLGAERFARRRGTLPGAEFHRRAAGRRGFGASRSGIRRGDGVLPPDRRSGSARCSPGAREGWCSAPGRPGRRALFARPCGTPQGGLFAAGLSVARVFDARRSGIPGTGTGSTIGPPVAALVAPPGTVPAKGVFVPSPRSRSLTARGSSGWSPGRERCSAAASSVAFPLGPGRGGSLEAAWRRPSVADRSLPVGSGIRGGESERRPVLRHRPGASAVPIIGSWPPRIVVARPASWMGARGAAAVARRRWGRGRTRTAPNWPSWIGGTRWRDSGSGSGSRRESSTSTGIRWGRLPGRSRRRSPGASARSGAGT